MGPRGPPRQVYLRLHEDATQRWADDPQSLEPAGACDLDSAVSDAQALLPE